jgi:hypothetical protein
VVKVKKNYFLVSEADIVKSSLGTSTSVLHRLDVVPYWLCFIFPITHMILIDFRNGDMVVLQQAPGSQNSLIS